MTAIAERHKRDLEAIREEIRTSTVEQLCQRYGKVIETVYCWQRQYGARCAQEVVTPIAKGRLPATQEGRLSYLVQGGVGQCE